MIDLEVRTSVPLGELTCDHGLVTWYEAKITDSRTGADRLRLGLVQSSASADDEGYIDTQIGRALVARIHLGLAFNSKDSLYDVCDADSGDLEALYVWYLDEDGLRREGEFVEHDDHDLFVVHDIHLRKPYRGRGLEMAIAVRLIETLGADCEAAFVNYASQEELALYQPLGFVPCDPERQNGTAGFHLWDDLPEVVEVRDERGHGIACYRIADVASEEDLVDEDDGLGGPGDHN